MVSRTAWRGTSHLPSAIDTHGTNAPVIYHKVQRRVKRPPHQSPSDRLIHSLCLNTEKDRSGWGQSGIFDQG